MDLRDSRFFKDFKDIEGIWPDFKAFRWVLRDFSDFKSGFMDFRPDF